MRKLLQNGTFITNCDHVNDKEVVFKNCAPFTDCTSETNITQIDNVVIPTYNLI